MRVEDSRASVHHATACWCVRVGIKGASMLEKPSTTRTKKGPKGRRNDGMHIAASTARKMAKLIVFVQLACAWRDRSFCIKGRYAWTKTASSGKSRARGASRAMLSGRSFLEGSRATSDASRFAQRVWPSEVVSVERGARDRLWLWAWSGYARGERAERSSVHIISRRASACVRLCGCVGGSRPLCVLAAASCAFLVRL
jgi:hypothetical protein